MKTIFNIIISLSIIAIAITLIVIAGDTLQKYFKLETIITVAKTIGYWILLISSFIVACKSYMNYHRSIVFEQLVELEAVTPKMEIFGELDTLTKIRFKTWGNFTILIISCIIFCILLKNF